MKWEHGNSHEGIDVNECWSLERCGYSVRIYDVLNSTGIFATRRFMILDGGRPYGADTLEEAQRIGEDLILRGLRYHADTLRRHLGDVEAAIAELES